MARTHPGGTVPEGKAGVKLDFRHVNFHSTQGSARAVHNAGISDVERLAGLRGDRNGTTDCQELRQDFAFSRLTNLQHNVFTRAASRTVGHREKQFVINLILILLLIHLPISLPLQAPSNESIPSVPRPVDSLNKSGHTDR